MQASLSDFIPKNFEIGEEETEMFQIYFQRENIKKNEILLHSGEICNKVYAVSQGLLRTFHTNKNGTEFTRLLVPEGKFCTILLSFQERIASPATIQALEESTVYSITHTDFRKLISESTKAKNLYTHILEEYQNFQLSRLEFLTTFNPQEKVEQFLAENSALEKRISSKVIASYLQITPETYSRCKKKMTS
ncbi:MAG: Crp/Fnr family transcriptional regulator [Kaistella sp.]